jgi:hypothetical protein
MNLKELHSFKMSDAVEMHDTLNPKLWKGQQLKLQVRVQLLKIAKDFIEYLGVSPLHIKDVRILGSNAAYSYTDSSDIDLHVFVDMEKLNPDDVYQELFTSKKMLYNDGRNITIHGIPVECYVQDINSPAVSLGEYSVLKHKWIKLPVKRRVTLDHAEAKLKYEKMAHLVKVALNSKHYQFITRVLNKISQYRKAGLKRSGEFSSENIAYKAVRNQGIIDKLYKRRDALIGKDLSIEGMYVSEDEAKDKKTPQIKQHSKWSVYTERSSQVGDGYVRWIEDSSTCYVIDIQAPRKTRGRSILEWLHRTTGKDLYAVGVVEDAEGFWDAMEEENIITGYTDEDFMKFFSLRENKILDVVTPTVQQIAKKHGVEPAKIEQQLKRGIKVEREHTTSDSIAREIALDHIREEPDYYDRLLKAKL